jgi:hypothetical protein
MLQSFPPYAMNFQDSGYLPSTAAHEKHAWPKKSAGEEEEYVFV